MYKEEVLQKFKELETTLIEDTHTYYPVQLHDNYITLGTNLSMEVNSDLVIEMDDLLITLPLAYIEDISYNNEIVGVKYASGELWFYLRNE